MGNATKRNCCLVTGGAGFIGTALSRQLSNRFENVVALDNLHPQVHKERKRPSKLDDRIRLVVGSVVDPELMVKLIEELRPSVLLHLAAETGTGQSLMEASRHSEVNVVGLTRVLDAMSHVDAIPEKILLTSSRAVYGEGAWRQGISGDLVYPGQRERAMLESGVWDFPEMTAVPFRADKIEPRPTSVYGATKLAQENVLLSWALAFGVQPIILRLQNVYGAGQSLSNPYTGIVSLFCQMARAGKAIPVYEDGAIVRDFVYIDDVAAAIIAALDLPLEERGIFDVGSGVGTTVLDLAQRIAKIYEAPDPVITGAFRHGDVRYASCEIERSVQRMGWAPKVSLTEGLGMLCRWIEENPCR